MSNRLICSGTFILALSLVLTSLTEAAEPIGWWKLDDGAGLTTVDSVGGHDGTLTDPLTWIEGIFGGALEFQGGNGSPFVDLGAWQTDGPEGLSVCWWAKWVGTNGLYQGFLSQREGTMYWWTELSPSADQLRFKSNTSPQSNLFLTGEHLIEGEWAHLAFSHDAAENTGTIYLNGEERLSGNWDLPAGDFSNLRTGIGVVNTADGLGTFNGALDEVMIFQVPLSQDEVLAVMKGEGFPEARSPTPPDGSLYTDTWVTLSWKAGDFAVSHDVYMGDNFDDVNDATWDSDVFRGNQGLGLEFYIAGFPPYAYPDGLVNGTTYYWRIDEVNEADPNSPWKGPVWSFMVPPKSAYYPEPADSAEFVDLNVTLKWTAGFGTKLHYIVFGEDFDEVSNTVTGIPNGTPDYDPGPLKLAKTYFWRVDEFDGVETHKGEVWSFTTEGAVSGPDPADGAVDVSPTQILTWDAGAVAASHEVYFGTDADVVKNATTASPEYKGPKALGEESYDPGKLKLNTTYYWRIDEVNESPDSPWAGKIWSFTTGDYFIIDDFEDYNFADNQIWLSWHDGLGYGKPGEDPFFAGNGTGSVVGGDETEPWPTLGMIVHSGLQSMPYYYDNNKQGFAKYSEAEHTLTDQRDWTEEGVAELSIWIHGNPASVGSFVEGPVGTFTMTAAGVDIWNQADEFHYAFKMLTGPGSIVAKVESVELTNGWAKAGVMIRETLDAGSKFAAVYITPTNTDGSATNGCRFQARSDAYDSATSDTSVATTEQMAISAPYWVKLERDVGGNFRGYYSANGSTWQSMSWNPQFITMSTNVYVGLALTSHNINATCEAKFSNVTITNNVSGQWTNQDIGIESNDAEPLYVAVSNSAGTPAVVVHDDPTAATIDIWTEWIIPLQTFADQGIDLTDVTSIAIGFGTKGNMTIPGGSGEMYIDDIRLYRPRDVAE
jgi:hypothetical protein